MRWTGAALSAGTALTNANVTTAGNGDTTGLTIVTGGSPSAVMATDGVDVSGASPAQLYIVAPRTATKFGVSQFLYTPKEITIASTVQAGSFRSASADAALFAHFTNGKCGIQNAAGSGVGTSSTVAMVVNHEYLIDIVCVVGTSSSNGRIFWRAIDLTDPTWNTTGEYFFDTGYTVNTGTADLTAHRFLKIGPGTMNTGFRMRQLGWSDLASVNTSLTASVAKSHFLPVPTSTGTVAQTLGRVAQSATGTNTLPAFTGSAAQTLRRLDQAAAGTRTAPVFTGPGAQTLPRLDQAASGTRTLPVFTGVGTQSLPRITQSATGTNEPEFTGAAAQTMRIVTQSGTGTASHPPGAVGFIAQTLGRVTQSMTGTAEAEFEGTAAQSLPRVIQSAAGTRTAPTFTGAAAQSLPRISQAGAGTFEPVNTGAATQALPHITQSGAGATTRPAVIGVIAQSLPRVALSAAGAVTIGDIEVDPITFTVTGPYPLPFRVTGPTALPFRAHLEA